MKMELIQPFINAADAVLAETLQSPTKIADVNMEEDAYRRKGVAAIITIMGDIEGRVIFDIEPTAATKIRTTVHQRGRAIAIMSVPMYRFGS